MNSNSSLKSLSNGGSDNIGRGIKFLDHQLWNLKYDTAEKSRISRGRGRWGKHKSDNSLQTALSNPIKRSGKISKSAAVNRPIDNLRGAENEDQQACTKTVDFPSDNCKPVIVSEDVEYDAGFMIDDDGAADTAILGLECEEKEDATTKTNAFDFLMDRNKVISPNARTSTPQTPTKKRTKTSHRDEKQTATLAGTIDSKSGFKISSALFMSPKSKKEKRSRIYKPRLKDETFVICEDRESEEASLELINYTGSEDNSDPKTAIADLDTIEDENVENKPQENGIVLNAEQSSSTKPSVFDLLMCRHKPQVEKKQTKRKRTRRSGDSEIVHKRAKNSSHDSTSFDVDSEDDFELVANSTASPKSIFPQETVGVDQVSVASKVTSRLSLKRSSQLPPVVPDDTSVDGRSGQVSASKPLSVVNNSKSSNMPNTYTEIQHCYSKTIPPDENTVPQNITSSVAVGISNNMKVIMKSPEQSKPRANNTGMKLSKSTKDCENAESKTSVSTPLRRSTRQRQPIVDLSTLNNSDEKKDYSNRRGRKMAPVFEGIGPTPTVEETATTRRNQKHGKSTRKVAPILDTQSPPILSPKSMAARINFLHSGVPANLRQKQTQKEHIRLSENPRTTTTHWPHVRQRCSSAMWTIALQRIKLPKLISLESNDEYFTSIKKLGLLFDEHHGDYDCALTPPILNAFQRKGGILYQHCKQIVSTCTNFPVRACFETFGDRNGLNYRPLQQRRGKAADKTDDCTLITKTRPVIVDADLNRHTMWTYKYRPESTELLRGNAEAVRHLRAWLVEWQAAVRDAAFDDDLFQPEAALRNTIVLHGAAGVGKTATVYALCAELRVNVLEINVSGRRTGKQLLQQVREATQSLQLGNHSNSAARMCLILIDDADLVFAHDENFVRDLHTLVTTSKRPIVLTASDTRAPHIARYVNMEYTDLCFSGVSAKSMTTLLQILCLIEGFNVDPQRLGILLEWNSGDVRRTLLYLQFWILSGGDYNSTSEHIHWNCVRALSSHPKDTILPHPVDIGMLWWNLPLIVQPLTEMRKETDCNPANRTNLQKYVQLLDCLSFCDCLHRTEGIIPSSQPHANFFDILDTNKLEPRLEIYKTDRSLSEDIQHYQLETYCRHFVPGEDVMRLERDWLYSPPADARRAYSHQVQSFNAFQAAIPVQSGAIDVHAFTEDYFPYLRELCRSREDRQALKPRRCNRGYSNLNSVGIYDISPAQEKTARQMFQP